MQRLHLGEAMTAPLIEKLQKLDRIHGNSMPRRWVLLEDVLSIVRAHEAEQPEVQYGVNFSADQLYLRSLMPKEASRVVSVCPDCDIDDCKHIRQQSKEARAEVVEMVAAIIEQDMSPKKKARQVAIDILTALGETSGLTAPAKTSWTCPDCCVNPCECKFMGDVSATVASVAAETAPQLTPASQHEVEQPKASAEVVERVRLAICKELGVNPVTHSYQHIAESAIAALQSAPVAEPPQEIAAAVKLVRAALTLPREHPIPLARAELELIECALVASQAAPVSELPPKAWSEARAEALEGWKDEQLTPASEAYRKVEEALRGMDKYFSMYPEFVPNPEFHEEMKLVIRTMKQALAALPALKTQPAAGEFATLRAANAKRQKEWDTGGQMTLSYSGNELAGEIGELCNVLKKIERERFGMPGSRATVGQAAEELADGIICLDLIGVALGIDVWAAVVGKFNKTSEKYGLTTRISPTPPEGEQP
jgi:hypothetical protein